MAIVTGLVTMQDASLDILIVTVEVAVRLLLENFKSLLSCC